MSIATVEPLTVHEQPPAIGFVGTGASLGLVWGVAIRLWMRFISTNPEFSWSGTLYIVGVTTLIGLLWGLTIAARRRGWNKWPLRLVRGIGGGSIVLLGMGAGMLVLPTAVFGGFALSGRKFSKTGRVLLILTVGLPALMFGVGSEGSAGALLGIGGVMLMVAILFFALPGTTPFVLGGLALIPVAVVGGELFEDLATGRALAGLLMYLTLLVPLVWGFGRVAAPTSEVSSMGAD